MAKPSLSTALAAIERRGALLIFPVQNRKEPASLWAEFYPKTPLRWEWDDSADNRVVQLWHIKTQIPGSGKVIYTKWYQGKATAFSADVFAAILRLMLPEGPTPEGLSVDAATLLETLESDSPLSTKQLKKLAGFSGPRASAYDRAMKILWTKGLVIALGEVDDGAFPSLEIGATRATREEVWREAFQLSSAEAEQRLVSRLGEDSLFLKEVRRQMRIAPAKNAGRAPAKAGSIPSELRFEDLPRARRR